MTHRTRIHHTRRVAVLRAGRGGCVYCGQPASTMDHLVPVCRGGRNGVTNLVPACVPCNQRKGARSLDEFVATMPPREQHRVLERIERVRRQTRHG